MSRILNIWHIAILFFLDFKDKYEICYNLDPKYGLKDYMDLGFIQGGP